VALGTRVLAIIALVRSISVNARIAFVNRDVTTAMNIRRCVGMKTSADEIRPSYLMGQTLRLETCTDKHYNR
jgi:hypothetical protein